MAASVVGTTGGRRPAAATGPAYAREVTDAGSDDAGGPEPGPGSGADRGADVLRVSRTLAIPLAEIEWRAGPSGGPGGQHANRTASRVEVWFDVRRSQVLGPRQRARLLQQLGPVVRASAGDDRSQARNRQLAQARLAARIAGALAVATPRRPTRPTAGSKERRLRDKRRRSEVKRGRRGPADADG